MLCRREFDLGNLPCVHVKFAVEHAVLNLPVGVDPIGGIWSIVASSSRDDILAPADKQYSGIDRREVVIDDRTSTPLNNFVSISDLIQWRVARQPEELAFCTIDSRGKEGKGVTWKKFDTKVAAVAMYLKNKAKIRPRDHVILMYTHSEDFVFAVHACINLGAVVIPIAPMDQNRLSEDVPAFPTSALRLQRQGRAGQPRRRPPPQDEARIPAHQTVGAGAEGPRPQRLQYLQAAQAEQRAARPGHHDRPCLGAARVPGHRLDVLDSRPETRGRSARPRHHLGHVQGTEGDVPDDELAARPGLCAERRRVWASSTRA